MIGAAGDNLHKAAERSDGEHATYRQYLKGYHAVWMVEVQKGLSLWKKVLGEFDDHPGMRTLILDDVPVKAKHLED